MIAAPILIIFLSLTLGATLIAYGRLMRELKELKTEKGSFEESGRQKAAKIMEEARDKALQMLEGVKIDAGENQQLVDEELKKIGQMQMDNYNNMIQKISKSIEDEAIKEVEEFRKKLETDAGSVQKTVVARVEEDYVQAKKQIETYKTERMKQVDRQVLQLMKDVGKDVLGKTMDFETHRELIMQALEEARKEHVFG